LSHSLGIIGALIPRGVVGVLIRRMNNAIAETKLRCSLGQRTLRGARVSVDPVGDVQKMPRTCLVRMIGSYVEREAIYRSWTLVSIIFRAKIKIRRIAHRFLGAMGSYAGSYEHITMN
jgi:hypothetical protein